MTLDFWNTVAEHVKATYINALTNIDLGYSLIYIALILIKVWLLNFI